MRWSGEVRFAESKLNLGDFCQSIRDRGGGGWESKEEY